ncbi:MAG: UDP-N-acetylglucosamine 2-epimerase (non-hydrolyzing) [Candidatus Paceibacterota bacterium]|jgi:UDP-N-acetylglucosamine 2-epimerase (non-hydrolysing)
MSFKNKKVLVVFGTRPEAIKLAPVTKELEKMSNLSVLTCVLRQQGKLLNDPIKVFDIKPNFDIDLPFGNHGLLSSNLFKKAWSALKVCLGVMRFLFILRRNHPDLVVVQGDTSTVFIVAFIAFHFKIPVAHVEAGLRSGDKYSPFPEEINRKLTGSIAELHFASTESAKQNLLKEGISSNTIWVTGNTVLDALRLVMELHREEAKQKKLCLLFNEKYNIPLGDITKRVVLITAHRRESFGEGMQNIMEAIAELARRLPDVIFVYPVHPNPNVKEVVFAKLKNIQNVRLIEPLGYELFTFLMSKSKIVLTDSGGIQEEVSFMGKPTLVMREVTERPEGVSFGGALLVGTDKEKIVKETLHLLENKEAYEAMSKKHTAFGDGYASEQIAKVIQRYLN